MSEQTSRLIALKVLNRYKPQSSNLSEILSTALNKSSGLKDHGFARGLVWGVVRYLKPIDGIISGVSKVKKIDPEIRNILRLGLFQLIYMKEDVPGYAAINESVELAKSVGKVSAAGFVNAVLRKAQSASDINTLFSEDTDILNATALKYSYPQWIVKRWFERFGENEAIALCEAGNKSGNLTIRANTLKVTREELKKWLEREGAAVEFCRYAPDGLRFKTNSALETLGSFRKGLFCVQDEASQLAGCLLGVKSGDEVLDLCCGAGVKSGHLAAFAGKDAVLTAVDNSASQLERARNNFKQLSVHNVQLVKADVLKFRPIKADKVFLDAPCSGLGAIRHKPDIKWNRLEEDITLRYPKLQSALLFAASKNVNPGGTLVYCTCTTEPEENENVVEGFLESNKEFTLEKPDLPFFQNELISGDGRFFRALTHRNGTDCFFGAKLKRSDKN